MQPIPFSGGEPTTPEEAVVGLLMQAGRKLRTRHPEDQVDPSTFGLAKLLMCSDALRVSDIANSVGLDASTVSRQIKHLEDKKIVERAPDPADGRACLVRLTDFGASHMRAAFQRRFLRIKAAVDPWSDEDKALLTTLLNRLATDLRDANDLDESRSNTT